MQLVSINVSKPKDADYNGETIQTGIFKKPIQGKVLVKTLNIEGDKQADLENHGGIHKAVYAFAHDRYDHWRDAFNDPGLTAGAFGENLTIATLDEAAINIGDRFRLGDCILEVSQPRMPCYKLGIALNNTRAPKQFTKSYRTGVYFRVIQEGRIEAGDELVNIHQHEDSVSVNTLFRALFDKDYQDTHTVFTKALSVTELAPEWRNVISDRLQVN
ncbi:MOSC domain-containing protein [Marinomonas transparens]|uniref:MOSC domain-containing protein n=1 Tax=Marinomonas transparens TaxID=2795388 RepID=A0A934N7I1_9GAMM|nr:MOSC domain-containing protein [Marinomonas transparens]MBJ7539081.1 MOSC domain-containing protein [Marinomonas transparens]